MPLTNQTISANPSFFIPNRVYRFQILPPDAGTPEEEYGLRTEPHNLPNEATPLIYVQATCVSIMRYPHRIPTACVVNFSELEVQENDKQYIIRPGSYGYHLNLGVTNYAQNDNGQWVLFPQPYGEFWTGMSCESRRRIGVVEDVSEMEPFPPTKKFKGLEDVGPMATKRTMPGLERDDAKRSRYAAAMAAGKRSRKQRRFRQRRGTRKR
jgi:hypothetical protein